MNQKKPTRRRRMLPSEKLQAKTRRRNQARREMAQAREALARDKAIFSAREKDAAMRLAVEALRKMAGMG